MSTNIVWHASKVSRSDRETLNNHKGAVLWFTGLSGSGKSTLAHAVEEQLYLQGARTYVLDGDNIRHGLSSNLGFSEEDRKENIRRIGEVAKLMMDAGTIVMTAFISPFIKDRADVRKLMPHGDFIEIYCNATLETCEKRDVKGLYKKARAGEIKNYTGIDSPYEAPENPDLTIDTGSSNLEDSVKKVMRFLEKGNYIDQKYSGQLYQQNSKLQVVQ
ncbi:MAG: adenylyl-sulfate kinase [Gammaproteobacteria bacterium]|jgi:adenylylsulfate kinase